MSIDDVREWKSYIDSIPCETCGSRDHDDQIVLCDGRLSLCVGDLCVGCDAGFHCFCLDPPVEMEELPEGDWFCQVCVEYMQETGEYTSPVSLSSFPSAHWLINVGGEGVCTDNYADTAQTTSKVSPS